MSDHLDGGVDRDAAWHASWITDDAAAPPDRSTRLRMPWGARLAAIVAIVAAPVAAWWVIGPNPGGTNAEDPGRGSVLIERYDYLISPPAFDPGVERAAGWAAVAALVAAVVVLATARRRRTLDRMWVLPVATLVLAGCLVGAGGRVVTAAVIGANIGGGMAILVGIPVVVALVIGATVWSTSLLLNTDLEPQG